MIRLSIAVACFAATMLMSAQNALAQETVFNVPSGDVLDKGKVYGEFDATYKGSDSTASLTPRVVVGAGGNVEVGLNIYGLGTGFTLQTTLSPTIKWRTYDGKENGWALLLGDALFLPVQNRTYDAGNYFYVEFARTWKNGTRATAGGYHFTRNVIASSQRAGGQFAFEQPVGRFVTVATDWYTGGHALGYVTPGVIIKLNKKITWYGTYQIGNRDVTRGNHQLLFEVGWNLN